MIDGIWTKSSLFHPVRAFQVPMLPSGECKIAKYDSMCLIFPYQWLPTALLLSAYTHWLTPLCSHPSAYTPLLTPWRLHVSAHTGPSYTCLLTCLLTPLLHLSAETSLLTPLCSRPSALPAISREQQSFRQPPVEGRWRHQRSTSNSSWKERVSQERTLQHLVASHWGSLHHGVFVKLYQ